MTITAETVIEIAHIIEGKARAVAAASNRNAPFSVLANLEQIISEAQALKTRIENNI